MMKQPVEQGCGKNLVYCSDKLTEDVGPGITVESGGTLTITGDYLMPSAEAGRKLDTLWSTRGWNYCSVAFDTLCEEQCGDSRCEVENWQCRDGHISYRTITCTD